MTLNFNFTHTYIPQDHYDNNLQYLPKIYNSIMVTNPRKIGRADAEKVMMYENFNSRRPFSENGHL